MKSNNSKIFARYFRSGIYAAIILYLLTLPPLAGEHASADSSTLTSPLPGSYKILALDGRIEIPFEIYRGDIRFQCQVNGHPTYMLLDDGFMWDQLLFWGSPEVDSLNLIYDGEISIGGDSGLPSKIANGITVAFPGVIFTGQTAIVTPFSSGNSVMWSGSIGQISATFFRHFVVDINFDRMLITLVEPDKFKYTATGRAVAWEPMGFGPWSIPAILGTPDGRQIPLKLLMDLGYNDQLRLVVGGDNNIALPKNNLPAGRSYNITRTETRTSVGRLPQIDIGGYQIHDPLVDFIAAEHSGHAFHEAMIGLNLLARFNLVFDYNRQQLYVEPNNNFAEPFEYSMTGFTMSRDAGDNYIIRNVFESSPASDAGLMAGDKVITINNKKTDDYDYFDLHSLFRRKNTQIDLQIERSGQMMPVSLILRRII